MADDEELWHVRMSPDEVKTLTLEQLDDLFRLELIEADTLVWQPGMSEWLPLSVVAGLGEEEVEPETLSIPVSEPPATTLRRPVGATTSLSWPPPMTSPGPSSFPPQVTRSAPPYKTPPPPPRPPSAAPAPAPASSWPPPAAWSDPAPRAAAPVSPLAMTIEAETEAISVEAALRAPELRRAVPTLRNIRPPARSSSGRWVIVLALLGGAAVTLYRNDVVHAAARSIGQEGTYLKLEASLGGPGFGTPRAVEQMAAAAKPWLDHAPGEPPPSGDAARESTKAKAEPKSTSSTSSTTSAPPGSPAPPAAAPPHQAPPAARAPTPAHTAAPAPDPVFKTPKGKKGKASEYDPLNPSL